MKNEDKKQWSFWITPSISDNPMKAQMQTRKVSSDGSHALHSNANFKNCWNYMYELHKNEEAQTSRILM